MIIKKWINPIFILCAIIVMGRLTVMAQDLADTPRQTQDEVWDEPINLSQSGAASQPVIVKGADEQEIGQVFWWDAFDGIMTAIFDGESWSDPTTAPLAVTSLVGEGQNARSVSTPVTEMPAIIGDNSGRAHALWLGVPDEETGLAPLLTSRLAINTTDWTEPTQLAESALIWDMVPGDEDTLHLVFIRTTHTAENPAGVVYRQSTNSGRTWSPPVMLYPSIYYRLLPAETARLMIIADGLGNVVVTSETARLQQPFIVSSGDAGETWTEPVMIGPEELVPRDAHLVLGQVEAPEGETTPLSEMLMLWQVDQPGAACAFYQQRSDDGGTTWGVPERILLNDNFCTAALSSLRTREGGALLVGGEGSANLLLSAWNSAEGSWSEMYTLGFVFENPELKVQVALNDLHLQFFGDQLVVVGAGQDEEIWYLRSDMNPFDWASVVSSPWSDPANMTDREGFPGLPAIVADGEGRVHVVWSEAETADVPGSTLLYTSWDGSRWSTPVTIAETGEGKTDQPSLVVVGDRLHLVWCSGPNGQIIYSQAYIRDAYTSGGWSEPQILSGNQAGNAPVLAVDLLGGLHVAYAVPVNDGRGIYYTHYNVNGDDWSEPVQVFDAVAEGWLRADYPSLTIDENGIVHIVWVKAPLPGYGRAEAVYYARSMDMGETWSEANLIAEGPYDEPHIIATLHGQILSFWRDVQEDIVRYRPTSDSGEGWDVVRSIPGLRDVTGSLGISADGSGALHVVAITQEAGVAPVLTYATWKDDSWQAGQAWSLLQGPEDVAGTVIAVQNTAGLIDVVLQTRVPGEGLWYLSRAIPPVMEAPLPAFQPEPTVTPTLGPTPLPTPTLRPTVIPDAGESGIAVLELGPLSQPLSAVWGVLLVFLLVAGVLLRQVMKR